MQKSLYDENETAMMQMTNTICSFLSVIGEIFIFWIFIRFRSSRTYEYKLIVFLSLADFIFSVGNLLSFIPLQDNTYFCALVGILITSGKISSAAWSFAIILMAVQKVNTKKVTNLRTVNITVWVSSNLVSFLALIAELIFGLSNGLLYLGDDILFCEIEPYFSNFLLVQLPSFILIVLDCVLYWKFIAEYKRLFCNGSYFNLMLYPIILAGLWIPSEIIFSINAFNQSYKNLIFMIISIGLSRITGLGNALIYGRQFFYGNNRAESFDHLSINETWMIEIDRESNMRIEIEEIKESLSL